MRKITLVLTVMLLCIAGVVTAQSELNSSERLPRGENLPVNNQTSLQETSYLSRIESTNYSASSLVPPGSIALDYVQYGAGVELNPLLTSIGFTVTEDDGAGNLNTLLPSQPWDLVILQLQGSNLSPSEVSAISNYLAGGGKLIMSYWNLNNDPAVQSIVGVSNTISFNTPISVSIWDAAHPIFNNPNTVSGLATIGDYGGGDNGDRLEPAAGATALGGFVSSPTTNEAAIVLGNGDRSIFHGFAALDMDLNSYLHLIENEVEYLMNPNTAPTISCPSNITVANDADECGAIVTYTVTANDAEDGPLTPTQTAGLPSGSQFPVGTTTNTFEVTDSGGNTSTCSFDVTVNDTEAPTFSGTIIAEILDYSFEDAGSTVVNGATNPPSGAENASLMGGMTQGAPGITDTGSLIGTGGSSSSDYLDTNWNTNLSGPWSISFQTSNIQPNATLYYIFGDHTAGGFRCFTNGVAGSENWILRGPFSDVLVPGGATVDPHVITFVYSPTDANIKAYLDGVLVNTVSQSPLSIVGSQPFKVGGYASNTGLSSGGLLDEFKIFNRELTLSEIEVLARIGEGCPSNIVVNNDPGVCGAVVTYNTPIGTDNCSGATTTQTAGLPSGSTFPIGTTTNTFVVTDAAGHTTSCSFDVTVEDNEAPVITCVPNDSRNTDPGVCSYTVIGTEFDATFTDNCPSATITNDYNGTATLAGETLPSGTTTVVWTVDDGNGQTATCSTDITVVDNQSPVITCVANQTRDTDPGVCNYTVVGTEFDATFTDNCGGTLGNNYNGSTSLAGAVFPIGSTTVVWAVFDGTNPVVFCQTIITIEDNEAPVITCVPNATRDTDAGVCSYTVVGSEFDATFTDNCTSSTLTNDYNGTATMAGEVLPKGVTTVVWTVDDDNGQTATCTTVITVEDNEAPVITCVPNATRDTDPGVCNYTVVGTEFDATFTDNCTDGSITNDYNGTATMAGEVLPKGVTTVIWTVDDGNGQTATCTTIITVEDNEAPVITCVPNATRDTDAGVCSYTVVGTEFDATFTDNCTDGSITNDYNGTATMAGEVLPKGVTTVIWTVDDGNGQTATCTTVITVEDNEAPVITCVPNATRDTDPGVCNYTVVGTEFDATFTDNCPSATMTNDYNGTATMAGEVLPKGVTTVIWTVDDGNGQTATCTTVITVEDNEAPVITCVPNATRDTDPGVCSYTVVGTEFDATFTDNCTDGSITNDYNGTATMAGEVLPKGVTTVIWTVDDGNGQTATCTTVITVEDNEDPVITCAPNATRDTDPGVCDYTVVGTEFDATFTDNCTDGSITNDYNGTATMAGAVLPKGVTTVIWTVDDGNGQTATCTTVITVEDNEAPVITCVPNATRDTDPGVCSYTVVGTEFDATFTDNCPDGSITNDYNGTATMAGEVLPKGVTTVVWTVDDGNGQTATCTTVITVEDNEAPVITCVPNATRDTEPGLCEYTVVGTEFDATFTDNCPDGSITNDYNGTATMAGEVLPTGDTTVVWTVDDGNGQIVTCTTVITIEDNELPTIICPADITANTDAGQCYATVTFATPVAFDNCGIDSIVQTMGDPSGSGFPVGVNVIEFTATDVNGNTSTCSFTITVTDNEAPVAVCQNITVQLDATGNATITAADVDGGSTDQCGIDSLSIDVDTFDCSDVGDNNVILTVTDVNGNTSTCTAIVTVEDVTAPMVVCQDITVVLDATGTVTIAGVDVDGGSTDACGIASYDLDIDTFDCSNVGDNIVTLTVTDVNGNSATCTATVTVEDNTSPVLVCQDFTLELGADGTAILDPSDVIASNDDACGIFTSAVDITDFDCSDIGAPVTVQVFTIDVNGNLATCTAEVTVVDNLAPVITCPADQTVDPGPGNIFYILPDYFATGEATAIDNCTDPVTITSQSPVAGTPLPDGVHTITLTATDAYGNTSTCEFELTVESVLGAEDNNQNFGSVKIYPVPTNNILNISNPQSLELERLEIYDLRGRIVQSADLRGMGNVKTINVDQLAAASYYVKIKGANGEITKRLIKK